MAEIPEGIASDIFDGKPLPASIPSRHLTEVKLRGETREEMAARAKRDKVLAPIQETMIETFAWMTEKEKAVDSVGPIYATAILWVRKPCEDLKVAANAVWAESQIIVPKNGILAALR